MSETFERLHELVELHEYEPAIKLCRTMLIEQPGQAAFWQFQLGLVYFETDHMAEYEDAPAALGEAVRLDPSNPDVHFWHGYTEWIIRLDNHEYENEITTCLAIEPDHPYALYVSTSGLSHPGFIKDQTTEELPITRQLLQRVLALQPGNLGALGRLLEVAIASKQVDEARSYLNEIMTCVPYVEKNCGIMNRYANGVFTQALGAERQRTSCQKKFAEFISQV